MPFPEPMSASTLPMPPVVQARLWAEAADMPAYAILDGARNELLLGQLHGDDAPVSYTHLTLPTICSV